MWWMRKKIVPTLRILRGIADRSGANLLLALKAFSMWSLSRINSGISRWDAVLPGCGRQGLAREKGLAEKSKSKILSTFSPAYRSGEINEICSLSDHLIFNQPGFVWSEQAKNAGFQLVYESILEFLLGSIQSMIRVQRIETGLSNQSVV
jgi:hypothetical protein